MKKLVIDRIEDNIAVCEDDARKRIEIAKEKLPQNAKEGCVLEISDSGEIVLDDEETEIKRNRLLKKQQSVFGENKGTAE